MDKDQLTQRLQDFKAGKISWLAIARDLQVAVEERIPINGNYIAQWKVRETRRALKIATELGIVDDPRIADLGTFVVSYLGFLKDLLNKETFDKVMQDVLDGKISKEKLATISREAQGYNSEIPRQLEILRKRMVRLNKDLKALQETDSIKVHLSKESNELEHTLRSIFDEEFKKAYAAKEEIKV